MTFDDWTKKQREKNKGSSQRNTQRKGEDVAAATFSVGGMNGSKPVTNTGKSTSKRNVQVTVGNPATYGNTKNKSSTKKSTSPANKTFDQWTAEQRAGGNARSWAQGVSDLVNEAGSYYSSWSSDADKRTRDFQERAAAYMSAANKYKGSFQNASDYEDLYSALKNVTPYASQMGDMYSNFYSQKQYDQAVQVASWQKKYQNYSYSQKRAAIEKMKKNNPSATLDERKWLEQNIDSGMTAQDYDEYIKQKQRELEAYNKTWDGKSSAVLSDPVTAANEWMAGKKAIQDEIDRVKSKKYMLEKQDKYAAVKNNADFSRFSKVKPAGNVLNGGDIREIISNPHKEHGSIVTDWSDEDWTQDEIDTATYIYNTQGKKAAQAYWDDYLKYVVLERADKRKRQEYADYATRNVGTGILASLGSVGATLASGQGLLSAAGQNIRNKLVGDEGYRPINYYGNAFDATRQAASTRGAISEYLDKEYGTIQLDEQKNPFWSKLLNGKGAGFAYQTAMSMADSGALAALTMGLAPAIGEAAKFTTVLLGGSAGSQGVLDALERGASDEQALMMGILNGTFEALFEEVSLDHLIHPDKNFLVNLLKQGFIEGSEEVSTSFMNNIADIAIMASNSEYMQKAQEYMDQGFSEEEALRKALASIAVDIGWDFVGGAISGGLMGGMSGARATIMRNGSYANLARGMEAKDVISDLQSVDPNSKLAARMQTKLDNRGDLSTWNKSRMLNQTEQAILQRDAENVRSAVVDRLTELGETANVDKIADAIVDIVTAQQMNEEASRRSARAIEDSTYGNRVLNELASENSEGFSAEWTKGINTEILGKANQDVYMFRRAVRNFINKNEESLAEEGYSVVRDENGNAIGLESAMPEEVPADINELSRKYGKGYQTFLDNYEEGQDVESYDQAFGDVYQMGNSGLTLESAKQAMEGSILSDKQIRAAYQAGREAADVAAASLANENRGKALQTNKKGWRRGSVSADGVTMKDLDTAFQQIASERGEKVRDFVRKAVDMMRVISEATGVDVVLYQSSTDENGKFQGAQGRYEWKDSKIYVDINAGLNNISEAGDIGKYIMMQTFTHEFVHFMEQWSPSEFNELRDLVFQEIAKKEDVDALIRDKQRRLGGDISYDQASKEVVADGLSRLLPQSKFVENLAAEHQNIFQRLMAKLKEFLNDLKEHFGQLGQTNQREIGYLTEDVDGQIQYVQDIVDLFDYVAQNAVENYQAASEGLDREKAFDKLSAKQAEKYIEAGLPVSPEAELEWSIRTNQEQMDNTEEYVAENGNRITKKNLKAVRKLREQVADYLENNEKKLNLPNEVIGNPFVKNGAYDKSYDPTTVCVRSLGVLRLQQLVSEKLGRPLTARENFEIAQEAFQWTDNPQCLYCFAALDRMAKSEYLMDFINRQNRAVKALNDGASKTAAYKEFLPDGHKGSSHMKKVFNGIYERWQNKGRLLTLKDASTYEKLGEIINRDDVGGIGELAYWAEQYAQNASWAKAQRQYQAYNGQILKWSQDEIDTLNSHYGLRLNSHSEFSPAFILEYLQIYTDAAARGLKALEYTSDINAAKIFAPTGAAINMSISIVGDSYDNMGMDAMQGCDWNEARAVRDQYDNAGIVAVALNDEQTRWALDQDWIDVVIPMHLVKTGDEIAKFMNWTNTKAISDDKKQKGKWKKGTDEAHIYPSMHLNDKATYLRALEENHLTPRFQKWLDNPNYMKLVNETRQATTEMKPLQPVFDEDALWSAIHMMEARGGYFERLGHTEEGEEYIADEMTERFKKGPRYFEGNPRGKAAADVLGRENVEYSKRDSEGNELTDAQQEFFKDSKARDKNGDLLRLYSGTATGGFTTFRDGKIWLTTVYDSARAYGGAEKGNIFAPSRGTEITTDSPITVKKRVEVATTSDDADSFFFDSQEDLAEFEKKVGGKVSDYMDHWELSDYEAEADDAEYEERKRLSKAIEREYAKYNRAHLRQTTIAELLKNPDAYLRRDFVNAVYAIDSNAAIDEDGIDSKQDLIDGLLSYYEEAHDEKDTSDDFFDIPVLARVPEGTTSSSKSYNDTHTVYAMYANTTHPYIVDNGHKRLNAKGSIYYQSIDYAYENSDKYDGVIINDVEVGPVGSGYGTAVIVFHSNQVKSVNNQNPTYSQDIQYSARELDDQYMQAVESGDMDTVQRMVVDAARRGGFDNAIPEQTATYKVRTTKPPTKTKKVYKVFTVDTNGNPSALFVSSAVTLPQNVWLDAQDTFHFTDKKNGRLYVPSTKNPNTEGGATGKMVNLSDISAEERDELEKRGYIKRGADGKYTAKSITALAYRPGWHAGDLPFFPQGGMKIDGTNYPNVHRYNQVVFECEIAADEDYTNTTTNKKGQVVYRDRQEMPTNGMYKFATNPMTQSNDLGAWYISGSLKIVRALTEKECNDILRENGRLPQEWQAYQDKEYRRTLSGTERVAYEKSVGALDLSRLGYTNAQQDAARKTLAPITYDDDGNVIPISQRFNPEVQDVRYQQRTEAITDTELLQMSAENLLASPDLTEGEREALNIISDRLATLQDLKDQRAELGRQYKEQQFSKGGDRAAAQETLAKMKILDQKIERAQNAVLSVKDKQVLKDVLQKARKNLESIDREKAREMVSRYRDRRDNAEAIRKYKKRINRDASEITKWIIKPNGKDAMKNVPAVIRDPIIQILQSIDRTSQRMLSGGAPTKADMVYLEQMKKLQAAMSTRVNRDELYTGYSDLPENFMENLNKIITATDELASKFDRQFVINQMTADELKTLADFVTVLKSYIHKATRTLSLVGNVSDLGDSSIEDMSEIKSLNTKGAERFMMWQTMRPMAVFDRFGRGGQKVFRSLMKGQSQLAFDTVEVMKFAADAYTSKEAKEWTKTLITVKLGGEDVQMPISYAMGLYELSKRKNAEGHLYGNGVRIATFKNGRQKISDQGHRITPQEIAALKSQLNKIDPRIIEVADALQQYMAEKGAEWGNYVSVARFGIEQFTEQDYYPIASDGTYLPASADEKPALASLYALLNMSFTKDLKENANNRAMVYDIFDVFANHMSSMAQYHSFALPVLDSLKWLNYQQFMEDEDGNRLVTGSVREQMARLFGRDAENGKTGASYAEAFVTNILKAINGTSAQGDSLDTLGMKALHAYNVSRIAYNVRVVMQQPMAITRAAMVMSPTSISKALARPDKVRANIQEMESKNGIAAWKGLGFYDVNVSRSMTELIKHDESAIQKVNEFGLLGAEVADKVTWAVMWQAAKNEVQRKTKLTEKDAGYWDAVNEIFDETIYRTQVVDSVLTKNEYLRSKSYFARATGSFMNEPMTTYSMLASAYDKFRMDRARGMSMSEAWKKNGKNIARTAAVYSVSAILLSVVQAVADAWRDDDRYETYSEKWWEAFTGNIIDELVPFNNLPMFSDVWNFAKKMASLFGVDTYGSDPRQLWLEFGQELYDGTKRLIDLVTKPDEAKYTWYGSIYKLLGAASGLTGMPLSTTTREVVSAWNNTVAHFAPSLRILDYNPGAKNEIKYAYADGYLTKEEALQLLTDPEVMNDEVLDENDAYWLVKGWTEGESTSKYGRLYKAMLENAGDFDGAMKELTTHGVKEKDAISQVKSTVGKWYRGEEETTITRDQAKKMLINYVGMKEADAEKLLNEWTMKRDTGIAYDDMKQAYLDGDLSYSDAVNYRVKYGGAKEEDAIATVVKWNSEKDTGIAYDDVKQAYLEGNITYDAAVQNRVKYGGADEDDAEEAVAKWNVEKETGYTYDNMKEAYMSGAITYDQAVNYRVKYGNVSRDTAMKTVNDWKGEKASGYAKDDVDDAFMKGKITSSEALKAYLSHGYDSDEAHQKVELLEFRKKYPAAKDIKYNAMRDYKEYCEADGIPVDTFVKVWEYNSKTKADVDANGNSINGSKRVKVLAYIDELPISDYEKDSLYYACGYAPSTLKNAPWHQR